MRKYTIVQEFMCVIKKDIIANSEEEAEEIFRQHSEDLKGLEFYQELDIECGQIEIDNIQDVEYGGEKEDDCYGDYLYDQWKDEVLMDEMRK